jgi:hypothetical protein
MNWDWRGHTGRCLQHRDVVEWWWFSFTHLALVDTRLTRRFESATLVVVEGEGRARVFVSEGHNAHIRWLGKGGRESADANKVLGDGASTEPKQGCQLEYGSMVTGRALFQGHQYGE